MLHHLAGATIQVAISVRWQYSDASVESPPDLNSFEVFKFIFSIALTICES